MNAKQIVGEVIRKEILATDIIRLTVIAPEVSSEATPGQFVMIRVAENFDPLLRRPFSIHNVSDERVQILFKVLGKGTRYLASREEGDRLDLVGPLGHGFSLPDKLCQNVAIVGGGMGIAPLFFLSKALLRSRPDARIHVHLGATRANELVGIQKDFETLGVTVAIATDDGSLGFHGYVTDLLKCNLDRGHAWHVYSCGPLPMMQKVAELCELEKWPCQVSLETMMACGISACLGCTIHSSPAKILSSSKPFLHVCKDGPVFDSGDVAWVR